MKKIVSVAVIIALIAVVLCFAACSGKDMEDMTTAMDEISSAIDDATTLGEELEEDLSSALSGDEETEEDMTSVSDDEKMENTTDETIM